jgi:hypothetical protein
MIGAKASLGIPSGWPRVETGMTTNFSSSESPDSPNRQILLVDDGELDPVAAVLESEGIAFERLRGGMIPAQIAPPRDLLIVTPRHVGRIRRGSPAEAAPGRPVRIIAVHEDSPAMRRRLRRSGIQLLVRLPAAPDIWRLLVARALYQGDERREDARVAVGSPVAIGAESAAEARSATILLDLSNRGCRLQTNEALSIDEAVVFTIAADPEAGCLDEPLTLRGRVRRTVHSQGPGCTLAANVFDPDMPEPDRIRLTGLINRWASGPQSLVSAPRNDAPVIPPCQLDSLPDLTLDDETDPPVSSHGEVLVRLAGREGDARAAARGAFESPVVAVGHDGPKVFIGRDLSARGMRIERLGELRLGERFRLALHGPGTLPPFVVHATVARDDGDRGFALIFDRVDPATAAALEKLVSCLPDIESLEDGEIGGLGAILSEIVVD